MQNYLDANKLLPNSRSSCSELRVGIQLGVGIKGL